MKEDTDLFNTWNNLKKEVQNMDSNLINKGEIWWCNLGKNVGFEEDGKGLDFERPILVLKVFNSEACVCVPLTTKEHTDKFHHKIFLSENLVSYAILSQIKTISTRRFRRFIGIITKKERLLLTNKLFKLLG